MFIHGMLKRPKAMTVTLICLVLAFSSAAFANENPASALRKLKAGNAKFVKGSLIFPNLDQARRTETFRNGQHPFAMVIACSDSRVPVETIFDRCIGDVFVIRVAGMDADYIQSVGHNLHDL